MSRAIPSPTRFSDNVVRQVAAANMCVYIQLSACPSITCSAWDYMITSASSQSNSQSNLSTDHAFSGHHVGPWERQKRTMPVLRVVAGER